MSGIKRKVAARVRAIGELNQFTRDKSLMDSASRTMLVLHVEDLQDELLRCSKLLEHCLWFTDTLAEVVGVEIISRHEGNNDYLDKRAVEYDGPCNPDRSGYFAEEEIL